MERRLSHSRGSSLMPPELPNPPKFGESGMNDSMDRSITLDERTGTELLMRGLSKMSDINLEDIEVSITTIRLLLML